MSASFQSLPPELYSAIIHQIPSDSLQQTVLSLTRALPTSPIPHYHLFHSVRLKSGEKVVQLTRRLRKAPTDAAYVRELALETWTVDADVLINLTRQLHKLTALSLFVGVNFAPEHLEELFRAPWAELQFISLRFRPYVQKATYYQFMKGAYFDTTLDALSTWTSPLPVLSIVQDPLDAALPGLHHFAQPLVFFRLDPFTTLVRSPVLRSLTHFRLRVPSRQIARYVYALPGSLENVELVDLSTCNVGERDVDLIVGRFARLKHLILDNCSILRGELRESEWKDLGKECALAGVRRAREREKKLKTWLEANHARAALLAFGEPLNGVHAMQLGHRRPAKRGRKGLSTATISLRDRVPEESSRLGGPSIPSAVTPAGSDAQIKVQKIRVLPRVPTLLSLATTVRFEDKVDVMRAEFERGWAEGIAQLAAVTNRLRASSVNGVRVMKFDDEDEEDQDEEGTDGLVDVDMEDFELKFGGEEGEGVKCPVLCLAGPGRGEKHVEGCGHQVGWEFWRDEL